MEINITMTEEGKFSINKSDKLSIFMAVGMLELAKKVMLTPDEEVDKEDINDMQ